VEKALKFLLVLREQLTAKEARGYGHKLDRLIERYKPLSPEFFGKLEAEGLTETLRVFAELDFVKLRYLEPHRSTSRSMGPSSNCS
jgi:hypothetical protein